MKKYERRSNLFLAIEGRGKRAVIVLGASQFGGGGGNQYIRSYIF
ncbi:hypothetical protein BGS_1421 [Beggiatoa sp. SS]|nr:hypothetical protein BGS_1421 [Beggiatoa sp. SS]